MSTDQKKCGRCETNPCTCAWLEGERRMENIGPNGPTAEHYDSPTFEESATFVEPAPAGRHPVRFTEVRVVRGYECLHKVLVDALDQAQIGKGDERHAQGQPFDRQPMQKLIELHGRGFAYGQAGKKAQESERLVYAAARAELLGAIVYLAGAVVNLDKEKAQ